MAVDKCACIRRFLRTKTYEDDVMETPLHRCMSTLDVTLMGIGMTITGIFSVMGMVIMEAGSAGLISFFLAGLVTLLCSFSYIELACRIPKAGSGYTYTYIAIGELVAFLVGWATWLEYLGSVSSCAKATSTMIDLMANGAISSYMESIFEPLGWPTDSQVLGPYPDFIALGIVLVTTAFFISGVRMSSWLISGVSLAAMAALLVMDAALFAYANPANFSPSPGGFAPFGGKGVIVATAAAFFTFVGFDSQTIASEELNNPIKSIPISMIVSPCVVTILLVISSVAISLFTPYYNVMVMGAAFIEVFQEANIMWAAYLSGVGGILGMLACILVGSYAAPRIIYSMARDGLLFNFISYIWQRTQVPVYAVLLSGGVASLAAMLLSLNLQMNYTVIAALTAYTLVGTSVVALRFIEPKPFMYQTAVYEGATENDVDKEMSEDTPLVSTPIGHLKVRTTMTKKMDDYGQSKPLTPFLALGLFVILSTALSALVNFAGNEIVSGLWWAIILTAVLCVSMIACMAIMMLYQQNDHTIRTFKVPLVPVLPCLGIMINIILIVGLPSLTWAALALWIATGLIVYFAYSARYSKENKNSKMN